MFKFIIKNNSKDLDELKMILSDYKGGLEVQSSGKGNYKSISFKCRDLLNSFYVKSCQVSNKCPSVRPHGLLIKMESVYSGDLAAMKAVGSHIEVVKKC